MNEYLNMYIYVKKNIENLSSEIAEYFPNPREDKEIYREQALVTPNTHGQNRISLRCITVTYQERKNIKKCCQV